jgi:DNA modification methylase
VKALSDDRNQLFFGDNLQVLRDSIGDESVDLIYLDPPFNSKRDYNLLFKTPKAPKVIKTGKTASTVAAEEPEAEYGYGEAQITAFEDTWHWGQQAENEFREILQHANTDVAELMRALRSFLKENDMMAYLTAMCIRLLELHRVLKPTGDRAGQGRRERDARQHRHAEGRCGA